ncbi:hypothetical protein PFISCL1PPCAC_21885, partial [Pristionchus fissidentatus]
SFRERIRHIFNDCEFWSIYIYLCDNCDEALFRETLDWCMRIRCTRLMMYTRGGWCSRVLTDESYHGT